MDNSAISQNAELAGLSGRSGAPLGITAKSSTTSAEIDRRKKRAERYEGLAFARLWLGKRAEQISPDKHPGDVYRTHDCRFVRRERDVTIKYSPQFKSAHFTGVATCGSVWACPVCCALIQQRRRAELTQLIEWAYAQGYKPCMVTFTFPHTSFDTLAGLQGALADAFKRLRSGNVWTLFKKRCGFGGLVRSLEVTHGANGWHPHTHELWLVKPLSPSERADFLADLKARWRKVCQASGLLDAGDKIKGFHFDLHSVDVRFDVSDSDYLAKQDQSRAWGADREIATSSSKSGRAKGVHPHEFLIRRAPGDRSRYFEYLDAMKGKSQLFWSHGLKDAVGIQEVSDEVVAQEAREDAFDLGKVSAAEWDVVRKKRKHAPLLDAAETGDWGQVRLFLRSLGCDPYT